MKERNLISFNSAIRTLNFEFQTLNGVYPATGGTLGLTPPPPRNPYEIRATGRNHRYTRINIHPLHPPKAGKQAGRDVIPAPAGIQTIIHILHTKTVPAGFYYEYQRGITPPLAEGGVV